MSERYLRIIRYVRETPWAIRPETMRIITELLEFRAQGGTLTREEIDQRIQANMSRLGVIRQGAVAVIPLRGVITHRAGMFSDVSGATSVERFRSRLNEALGDDAVSKILLDVDSPGGSVDGIPEIAEEINRVRQSSDKSIAAVVNTQSASAAYWITSQVEEIAVTPSGEVGSIGVYAAHRDVSEFEKQVGVKTTLISAGRYKTEASPFEPLTEEAHKAIQKRVNEYYDMFVDAVARGRGVTTKTVREGFGEGRMVGAKEAVKLGMADRVATPQEMIQRLQSGRPRRSGRRATVDTRRFVFI